MKAKAIEIVNLLDRGAISVRQAGEHTGIAAADFSRIHRVKLERFTIDRLITILGRLDQRVEVNVKVRPVARAGQPVMA